jgi:hypothetical protein
MLCPRMKNFLKSIMKKSHYVPLILLLSYNIPDVFATADGPDYWQVNGVEQGEVLNIRQEANEQSRIIGEIPSDGQCIKNLKCVGGLTFEEFTTLSEAEKETIKKERPRWCYIEYRGIRGWVAGRYLREGACEPKVKIEK